MNIHSINKKRLSDILIKNESINQEQAEYFNKESVVDFTISSFDSNTLTQEQLTKALAEQFKLEYVSLENFSIPLELFNILPASHVYQYHTIPYKKVSDTLYVVISDPLNIDLVSNLRNITGLKIKLLLSTVDRIEAILKKSEGGATLLKDTAEDFTAVIIKENSQGQEQIVSLDDINETTAPVINLVNTIIKTALQKRVSDIHLETSEKGIKIKYRIDGVLYPATDLLDAQYQSSLMTRIKVMAELDIAEKRKAQDGRFKLRIKNKDIDFRVSILPSIHGEDIVIRVLDKHSINQEHGEHNLESLGFDKAISSKLRRYIREPYGMVLITGPTGSGKTTTLYAALNELNTGEEKIITIEDPVEYQLENIVQIPVNNKKNMDFASGLRSILRHDPDKIMVGEIRDHETANIAVQSALTGHMIFSTVHANNVFDVLSRFVYLGVEINGFATALNCVVSQRLVRKLCVYCKQKQTINEGGLLLSEQEFMEYKDHIWYEAKGCSHCNDTGYYGRTTVTEILNMTQAFKDMVLKGAGYGELKEQAKQDGWNSIRNSALNKAAEGITSLAEINRVTFLE